MLIRYSQWSQRAETRQERMESLLSLFSYILMKTGGDVDESLEWMQYIDQRNALFDDDLTYEEFVQELTRRGFIADNGEGQREVTAKGKARIRQDALLEVFSSLRKSPDGFHDVPHTGSGIERTSETRAFSFGDAPSNIDLTATMRNAYARGGIDEFSLTEDDVEVHETEHQTSAATVLLVDVSHSMILYGEDRITPAKQVALALSELIMTRYPKDQLRILLFGDDAVEISIKDLPFAGVGPFHTNTREGLRLARSILRRSGNVNKQIFMVTDGKPSAMFEEDGRLYKNSYGLDPRIVNKTLDEAVVCRRERIVISTFMVARDPLLVEFVEELTKANHGRAYFTGLQRLGEYVIVDYIRNRRKTVR
jgi:Ca-activated chloride channel homolog